MFKIWKMGLKIILSLCFIVFFIQYLLDLSGANDVRIPVVIDIILYVYCFVAYLRFYRKDNLFCFELMAVPIAFLGLFFDDLIAPNFSEFSRLIYVSNESVRKISEDIQLIAYFALLLGGAVGSDYQKKNVSFSSVNHKVSYDTFIMALSIIILLLIIYDYRSGVFSSWFYYSNRDVIDVNERNKGLGHLTCLLLAASCVEIVRLRGKGVMDLKGFIKQCNKVYIADWLIVSLLLFVSGNRNEMLLILLPLVVGYSVCIQRISNKVFIVSVIAGALLMAMAGMTRTTSVSLSGDTISVVSLTRDFSGLGYNTDYLIEYTNNRHPTYLQGLGKMFLSGIPYIGNVIINLFGVRGQISSATICTDSILNATSGLGTSLIGDLYYTGGLLWVIVFMFLFGYIMSRLYMTDNNMNIFWLVFYSYMVSNAIYYVRSSWSYPITEIEYAIIIILLGNMIFKKGNNNQVI